MAKGIAARVGAGGHKPQYEILDDGKYMCLIDGCAAKECNTYWSKQVYLRHRNKFHIATKLNSKVFYQCEPCGEVFVTQTSLDNHVELCPKIPVEGLVVAVEGSVEEDPEVEEVPDEDEHGFDAIHDLIMDVDGMKDLLGMYREGLYHIHRAWQLPFFTINVKLLLGMASNNDEEVIMNTLAFSSLLA